MLEVHEFTLESKTIDLLLKSIRALLAYSNTNAQAKIDLTNMAVALNEAEEMRVTFNLGGRD